MRISEAISRYGVRQARNTELERELASRLHTTNQNHNVIRVEDVVAPCLRQAYFACVLGHRTLALEIRRVATGPVVEGLKVLGWGEGTLIVKDLGNFKLVGHVDAVRDVGGVKEAAIVHVGRPNQASTLRAAVVAALTCWRIHLVCVSPVNASINASIFECAPEQCRALAEVAPPERGRWCVKCPYQQLCTALQKIKEVTPHV